MTTAPDLAVSSRLASAVHRHSPVPLHHQIKVAVLQGVEEGWLQPGEQLPRERELAGALGVSLAPVRQAMTDLTKEGYVDRTRGKGTFVRDRKLVEKIQILGSFHDSVRRQGLDSTVQVLSSEFVKPPHEVAVALALRGQQAWRLRRLALTDGEPLALLTAWLPPRYARGVSEPGPRRRLAVRGAGRGARPGHGVGGQRRRGRPGRAGRRRAAGAGAWLAGDAGIGITRNQQDRPVEYSDVRYRPERFRFADRKPAAGAGN